LDEWIYFLKHEEVKEGFKARGLAQAKERLDVAKLPEAERRAYDQYVEDLSYQASLAESSFGSGRLQGRKEGAAEGRKEGLQEGRRDRAIEIARSLLDRLDDAAIAEATGLVESDVAGLRANRGEPRG
jgi:flagellar biosynthesis/type III secretory pathway protein FliH